MYDNSVSENGKSVSEVEMTSSALVEMREWVDILMDEEFQGRGDREKTCRGRLSEKSGVAESYLFRIQYKFGEMKDVAGSAYRAMGLYYDDWCSKNEEAAARYKAKRLALRNGHAADHKRPVQGVGMDTPPG
ncbi:MAG: hypothetical protein LCH99_15640 [Proteobacteria bacterium]|nr:hypothetical protein [Pseudomonadota bacterium]